MQTTIDNENRREFREKILNNLSAIINAVDELDRTAAVARNHLHLHDRFFFQHAVNLQEDETYGTADDLGSLYQDTCQVLERFEKAQVQMKTVCTLMHFYDYSTNPIFSEFAEKAAEQL
jgi:hypothetical protein